MIISDLSYLEVASENQIQGGIAFADANADAFAKGKYFAATYTDTYTVAISKKKYSVAKSGSTSSSVAA